MQVHTGFEGAISSIDKACETCYRAHLTLLKSEENSDNEDLDAGLVNRLKNSVPILQDSTSIDDVSTWQLKLPQ